MNSDKYKEYQKYKDFPFALSIARIEKSRIFHFIVSKEFYKLFNLEKDIDFSKLNHIAFRENIFEEDLLLLHEINTNLLNNKINEFNIIIRLKIKETSLIKLVNIIAKKLEDDIISFIYNDISESKIYNDNLNQYIQHQQTLIAEQSQKAIIVISKKDYSVLYLNKVAKDTFNKDEKDIDNTKCYNLLNDNNKKCLYCPIFDENYINKDYEIKHFDKTFKLHIVKTIWNNEEAFIEYFFDITKEKQYNHLYNLYKSLVSYKKNTEADVGALFCFDVETSNVLFYFLNATNYNFDNKTFDDVINAYYPFVYGDEDKRKFKKFLNFEKIVENNDINDTQSIDYHQVINNEVKILRVSYSFLQDPNLNRKLLIINVYDISERYELEKMVNALVSYQNEFVTREDMITKEMIVFARKDNFLKFPIGYSRYSFKDFEDHVHKTLDVVETYGDKRLLTCKERNRLVKNKPYSTTYVINIDGEIRHKRSLGFRDDNNSLFTVVYDVTDLALLEKEKNQKLTKTNQALIKAEKEAIEANKSKSEFLSRMSHDMRTPLGAIISLSSFGIEECENLYFSKFFNQINENAQYLLSLVNDILDFQKLDNSNVELIDKVSKFGDTEKAILRIVELKAKEKNIQINFKIEREIENNYIIIDEKKMKQILINLLNNAIKYTHSGGFINWSIVLKKDKNGNPLSIYTIEDNGVGMSKKFQKNMFTPFVKEYNELSDSEGGTGLGLVIAKRLVESMNGDIKCFSEINKGTKFVISISRELPTPLQIEKYKKELKLSNNFKDLKNIKILVCEDVLINQLIIRKILEEKKAIVSIVDDGIKGVNSARENNFDAILMDIRMPKLNGLKATQEIRKFNKNIPIIALSANAFSDDINRSLKYGMDAHLSKPIKKEELYLVLSKLIKK